MKGVGAVCLTTLVRGAYGHFDGLVHVEWMRFLRWTHGQGLVTDIRLDDSMIPGNQQ